MESETITIERLTADQLRPDMAEHRRKVIAAWCKAHNLDKIATGERYAAGVFDGVMNVPLIGGMIFAHTVKSACKVLDNAVVLTHHDIATTAAKTGIVPSLSGSRVGNKNAGENA